MTRTEAEDELNNDRRHLELRACPDGSFRGEFRLTGVVGAKLVAILGPLAKPRTNLTISPDGRQVDNLDGRTHGQRMHDALGDACDRLLRAGGLPDTGGTPTTLLVTISYEDLLAGTGHGTTSDGTQLPARQVLELADQADIIPTVLNQAGAVLSLGRTRRIAGPGQTLALIARDGGCSFPGCSHPPDYCERHHIKPWIEGGLTNLDNLTLLCRYHHHNFATHGWTCQINRDGLPVWTAPAWIDRSRTPMMNQRIQSQVLRRKLISA